MERRTVVLSEVWTTGVEDGRLRVRRVGCGDDDDGDNYCATAGAYCLFFPSGCPSPWSSCTCLSRLQTRVLLAVGLLQERGANGGGGACSVERTRGGPRPAHPLRGSFVRDFVLQFFRLQIFCLHLCSMRKSWFEAPSSKAVYLLYSAPLHVFGVCGACSRPLVGWVRARSAPLRSV